MGKGRAFHREEQVRRLGVKVLGVSWELGEGRCDGLGLEVSMARTHQALQAQRAKTLLKVVHGWETLRALCKDSF